MLADIDRHIMRELAENNVHIAKYVTTMDSAYRKIVALQERNTALIMHLVGIINESDTKNGSEAETGK